MSILVAILGFNLLIVVHELGHFLLARASGMRVLVFSIGFGPAILKVNRGGTVYQLAALPLGGYVRIHGQGPDERDERPDNFHARPWLARFATVAAGPFFNLLLAALIYVFLFAQATSISLDGQPEGSTLIRSVQGAAVEATLQPGDLIEALNETPVRSHVQLAVALGQAPKGQPVSLRVVRPPEGQSVPFVGEPVSAYPGFEGARYAGVQLYRPKAPEGWARREVQVQPEAGPKGPRLGVGLEYARFGTEGLGQSLWVGSQEAYALSRALLQKLHKAMRGEEKVQLASAVKITEIGADTFERGPIWFVQFLAFLSINLGLLNLLPLPALDGGRLLFLIIEVVARRPVSRRVEGIVHAVGMLFLLGMVLIVLAGDILSYF